MTGDIIVGAACDGHNLLDWATPIFTFLGVLVLPFYTYYAKQQRDEAKRANDLTEKAIAEAREAASDNYVLAWQSLELGRRAWIVTTRVQPEPMQIVAGAETPIAITIINVGSTPATSVINRGAGDVILGSDLPEMISLEPGDKIPSSSVVGEGQEIEFHIYLRSLSEEKVAQVESGKGTLYLYFRCEYRDVFRKDRWTIACWQYDRLKRRRKHAPKHNLLDTITG